MNNDIPVSGWIYVLSTATHSLLKIGFTTDHPDTRAKQLSDTSSPDPHLVEFAQKLKNPYSVETSVHKILDKYRHRSGREFFNCTLEQAVETIRKTTIGIEIEDELYGNSVAPSKELLRKYELEKQDRIRRENDIKRRQEKEAQARVNSQIAEAEERRNRSNEAAREEEKRRDEWSIKVLGKTYSEAHPSELDWGLVVFYIVLFPIAILTFIGWIVNLFREHPVYKMCSYKCTSCGFQISRASLDPKRSLIENCTRCNFDKRSTTEWRQS